MTTQTSAANADKPVVLFLSHGVTNKELVRVTFDKKGRNGLGRGIGFFRRRTVGSSLAELIISCDTILDDAAHLDLDSRVAEFASAAESLANGPLRGVNLDCVDYILLREEDIPLLQYSDGRDRVAFDRLITVLGVALASRRLDDDPPLRIIFLHDNWSFTVEELSKEFAPEDWDLYS